MIELSLDFDEVRGTDLPPEAAADAVVSAGVRLAEVRIPGGRHAAHPFSAADPLDPVFLATVLRDRGLTVSSTRTNLFLCPALGAEEPDWLSPADQRSRLAAADHLGMLDRMLRDAETIGAHSIGCYAFWREGDDTLLREAAVETLAAAAARVRRAGFELVLHNDHRTLAGTGRELAGLLAAVGDPGLTAAYDIAEAARLGSHAHAEDVAALGGSLRAIRYRDQVVDIRVGWMGGRNRSTRPDDGLRRSFGFWGLPARDATGTVGWGRAETTVHGPRTWLSPSGAMDHDYRHWLAELPAHDGVVCVSGDFTIWGVSADERIGQLRAAVAELAPAGLGKGME